MTRTETAWAGTDLDIRNPILDSLVQIDLKPKTDKRFINLSLGDPTTNLQLQPPQVAIDAVVSAVQSGLHNGYGPVDGLPSTKAAVADFYSEKSEDGLVYAPADVFMMNGASEALDTVITVLCAPRSNILFPRPGFAYCLTTSARRVEDRYYNLIPEQEWAVDLQHMETLVDDKTTAIVLTNPSNPCGSNYTAEHLTDILDFAARHRLPVISDEIYGDIVFKGEKFTALAALNHARSQACTPGSSPPEKSPVPLLTVGGLAKRWLVPGWRIGWILLHDPLKLFGFNIAQVLKDACTTSLAPSSITQAAVPTILRDTPKSFYDNALEVIEGNALLCAEALGKIEGLKVVRPRGSLYMLVGVEPEAFVGIKDEWDFVQKLVWEEAVFPIPGKCFRYEGYMRIVTASKREDLVEACVRLEDFCRRHRK